MRYIFNFLRTNDGKSFIKHLGIFLCIMLFFSHSRAQDLSSDPSQEAVTELSNPLYDEECSYFFEGEFNLGSQMCSGFKVANDLKVEALTGSYITHISFQALRRYDHELPADFSLEIRNNNQNNTVGTTTGIIREFSEYQSEFLYSQWLQDNDEYFFYKIDLSLEEDPIELVNPNFEPVTYWMVLNGDCSDTGAIYMAAYYVAEPDEDFLPLYQYYGGDLTWSSEGNYEGIFGVNAECIYIDIEMNDPVLSLAVTDEANAALDCVENDDFYYVSATFEQGVGNATFTLSDGQGTIYDAAEPEVNYFFGPYLPGTSQSFSVVGNTYSQFNTTGHIIFEEDYELCAVIGVEKDVFEDFIYFPNPVKENLTIDSQVLPDKLQIYNLRGQLVKETIPSSDRMVLNLESLSAGMYLLKIYVQGKTQSFKLIKEL